FQHTDELSADVNLANADRMHPKRVTIGNRLFEPGVVSGKSLAEILLPISATPHAPEIIRQGQDKKDPEYDVINQAHRESSNAGGCSEKGGDESRSHLFLAKGPRHICVGQGTMRTARGTIQRAAA